MKIIIATATLSSHSILLPGWIQAYLLVPRCLAQKVTESIKAIKGWNVNSMTSWKKFKRIAEKKNSNIFFLQKKKKIFLDTLYKFLWKHAGKHSDALARSGRVMWMKRKSFHEEGRKRVRLGKDLPYSIYHGRTK